MLRTIGEKMDNKRFLAEILNDKISIHDDFYFKGKELLNRGIFVEIRGFNDSNSLNHMLHSFFLLYKELFRLVINEEFERYSQRVEFFSDDKFSFTLFENGTMIWNHVLLLDDLDSELKDVLGNKFNKIGIPSTNGSPKILYIKLVNEGSLRKAFEKIRLEYQTPEFKITRIMDDILANVLAAHGKYLSFPSEEEYNLLRMVQRLEFFGLKYDKDIILKKDFSDLLLKQVLNNGLFKDPFHAFLFANKMNKKIPNASFMKEVDQKFLEIQENMKFKIKKIESFLEFKNGF